jgi:hypothetical protein
VGKFNDYPDHEGSDPAADAVSYQQGTLWLSPDELAEMISEMLGALRARAANKPAPDRAPSLLSPPVSCRATTLTRCQGIRPALPTTIVLGRTPVA